MKQFDPKVPTRLCELQKWFGGIIAMPIDENSSMKSHSPSGGSMEDEAAMYILPSATLDPKRRLEIYNQQYWWRLLSILQETYSMLVRIFGYYDFNREIAIPYLSTHPPSHWSLNTLGDQLSEWIQKCYQGNDKQLVLECSRIDWAYHSSFFSRHISFNGFLQSRENDLDPLCLQSHLCLFQLRAHLFDFREKLLEKEPDEWLTLDFPQLEAKGPCFFVVYRDRLNHVRWEEIEYGEYHLLTYFEKGISIEELVEIIENNDTILQLAGNKLQSLFLKWTKSEWLKWK